MMHKNNTRLFFIIILLAVMPACTTLTGSATPQPEADPQAPAPATAVSLAAPEEGLTRGKADAPAKIEVFEDLQCPACLTYSKKIEPQVISELVDTGKASYTFRHYPFLDGGNPQGESRRAADASLCASEQGMFWEYKTEIFANWAGENNGAYNDKNLAHFAANINLNMDAFNTCFTNSQYKDLIDADIERAGQLGVQGTPSVFVNGKLLTPGYIPSFEDIQAAVEAAQ